MTEILLGDHLLTFDGRVVEVFGFGGAGESVRYHVSLIQTLLCAPGLTGLFSLNFSTKHGGILGLKVPTEKRAEVEALVEAVKQAKTTYRMGQNT